MRHNPRLHRRFAETERQRICLWPAHDNERRVLHRRMEAGEVLQVHDRLYARAEYWSTLTATERYLHVVRSYAKRHPQWVFGDMTAAAVHGINDSKRHMRDIHIMATKNGKVRDYGHIRHHYMRELEYVIVDGLRVTSLSKTVFDCARNHTMPDAMAVVEAALRGGLITRNRLLADFGTLAGRNRGQALRTLEYAQGKTENGGEAYCYGAIIDTGFIVPELQVELRDPLDPTKTIRPDFLWRTSDGRVIAGELDGRVKYRDSSMFHGNSLEETIIHEKEREERLRMIVDDVVRFSFAEAYRRTPLVRKLEAAGIEKRSDGS